MKESNRSVIIIVIVLLAIAVFGILGVRAIMNQNSPVDTTPNFVSVPSVATQVISSDGSMHEVDIDFTVKVSDELMDVINVDALHSRITQVVSGMDYEKLRDEGNIDYIVDEILSNLSGIIPADQLDNIYLGNFVVDFPATMRYQSPDPGTQSPESNSAWNELFQNANK